MNILPKWWMFSLDLKLNFPWVERSLGEIIWAEFSWNMV